MDRGKNDEDCHRNRIDSPGKTDDRSIDRKIIQRIVTNYYDKLLDRKNYKSIIFEESPIER